MMKNKWFRLIIAILGLFPAALTFFFMCGGWAGIPFIAALIIYIDYNYETAKLFMK